MLNNYDKLLRTDCVVVQIGEQIVYPIFKVGSSTLMAAADRKHVNWDIRNCHDITVLIRDPAERFTSGLKEHCQQNHLDIKHAWEMVNQGQLVDRHFAPQYLWLMNLYRFYKGTVTLRSFEHIKKITNKHHNGKALTEKIEVPVPVISSFVNVDYLLMKHIDQTVLLRRLIEDYRHALS